MKQPDYHLTIRIEPGHQGKPDIRLRLALKELLRRFGIRAVSIKPAEEQGESDGSGR